MIPFSWCLKTIWKTKQFSQNYLLLPQFHIRYSLRNCRSNADTILTEKVHSQLTLTQRTLMFIFLFYAYVVFFLAVFQCIASLLMAVKFHLDSSRSLFET